MPPDSSLWLKPPSGSGLKSEGATFYHPWFPEYQRLQLEGFSPWNPEIDFNSSVIFGGRHKEENLHLVRACQSRGPVSFLIPNEYGSKSYKKLLAEFIIQEEVGRKSRLMMLKSIPGDSISLENFVETAQGYTSTPGLFCWNKPDRGSEILASTLEQENLKSPVLDLGAGWGYLCSRLPDNLEYHLLEGDSRGLKAAQKNLGSRNAHFHWCDVTDIATVPESLLGRASTIITNPPFHTHKKAEPLIGGAFVASASRLLRKRGALYLVGNVHLGYGKLLTAFFSDVKELVRNQGYSVFKATKK